MEPLGTEPYKGVRDFYPADWAKLQAIFNKVRDVLVPRGYEEYNASPLERAELYEAKTSEEIVSEQTYTFTDRGARSVTLRPEMTPTLARMVAHKRRELVYPLRWFSIGNRFRYERPQKGRLREFYQADIDLVGAPEGQADTEIVRLAWVLLKAFGATEKDFSIRMNSRALLNAACKAAGIEGDRVQQYLRFLDRKAKMTPKEFADATGTLGDQDPLALIEQAESTPEVQAEKEKILARVAELQSSGIGNVVFDPLITRGFDYYTGMVFEVFDTDPENARSLFGGGRYDGLVTLFGGEAIPAVGFAFGDVTLADFFETHGIVLDTRATAPQIYLGTPSPENIPAAQEAADLLRQAGVRVFVNITDRGLGDQVKEAVKRGIPYFAAYGADEVASQAVRLKALATSEENAVPLDEVASRIRGT